MYLLIGIPPLIALYHANFPLGVPHLNFASQQQADDFVRHYRDHHVAVGNMFNALIALGLFVLRTDVDNILKKTAGFLFGGQLKAAKVNSGGAPPPTQRTDTRYTNSGKDFPRVQLPPRYERAEEGQAQKSQHYKIVVEIAGQALAGISRDRVYTTLKPKPETDSPQALELKERPKDKHRVQVTLADLPETPAYLWLQMQCTEGAGGRYDLPLGFEPLQPVDSSVGKDQWSTVLVPVLPVKYTTPAKSRQAIDVLKFGWIYVYVDGKLWREVQVVDSQGGLRDVNLGDCLLVEENRRIVGYQAPAHYLLLPYQLNGKTPRLTVAYSQKQWSWSKICQMGGIAAADPRFRPHFKTKSGQTPVDPVLQQQLVPVDLSSYEQRFSAPSGCIGAIQDVMALTLQQFPFQDFMYRYENDPIAVLYLDNPVVPVAANIDEITPIAQYIAGEMNTNAHGDEAKKILGLNTYSEKECMKEYRNQPWFTRLLNTDMAIQCSANSFNFPKAALVAWALNVWQGACWDHKTIIPKKFHPRDKNEQQWHLYGKDLYYHDIWSNVHYGYVGKACGFSDAMLLDGAGLEQYVSDWARFERPKATGNHPDLRKYDHEHDRVTIEIGIALYNNYPDKVTAEQILKEVLRANLYESKKQFPTDMPYPKK